MTTMKMTIPTSKKMTTMTTTKEAINDKITSRCQVPKQRNYKEKIEPNLETTICVLIGGADFLLYNVNCRAVERKDAI